ncbi:glutathione S-transferase family protein [Pikeienuella sp. HZG-20]|uniref:glutathione S-transferase family protein n=1 Tax=Paludibacillus litoralis TaxID=3133267 RepID=UPI0030EE8D96
MIDLYTWSTPNGRKVSIALEEMQLPYEVHAINIGKNDQFAADFLKISPNNKIPAIRDRESGQTVFESGAILIWLAEKTGRFLPSSGPGRVSVMEWLMWQMGGFGPMLGQTHHFLRFNPGKAPYAEERFGAETKRLYGVLDRRLADSTHIAGEDLSIADFATWPWASRYEWQQIDLDAFPNVKRWYLALAARDGFRKGYDIPATGNEIPLP